MARQGPRLHRAHRYVCRVWRNTVTEASDSVGSSRVAAAAQEDRVKCSPPWVFSRHPLANGFMALLAVPLAVVSLGALVWVIGVAALLVSEITRLIWQSIFNAASNRPPDRKRRRGHQRTLRSRAYPLHHAISNPRG